MMKLMIVDDSNIIRSRIARILLQPKLKELDIVALAKNGREAVDMHLRYKPELVTMDLTMPEMDGVACIEALVKISPNIRIIVISALSDKATALKALKKGARGFLQKPFSDEHLANAILELMH